MKLTSDDERYRLELEQVLVDIRLQDRQAMTEPWKLVVATATATAAIAVAYANFL